MNTDKLKVITDLEKLSDELREQIKLVYPKGYSQHLISFKNKNDETVTALRFETNDKVYLIRMSAKKARAIISEDNDYDDDGYLKEASRDKYEDKHSEVEYLSENDNYDEPYTDDDDD